MKNNEICELKTHTNCHKSEISMDPQFKKLWIIQHMSTKSQTKTKASSFKLMGHFWWAIVVICAIVLIFARWAKKWVQNKTHHITITFSWLCDELIQATILLKWYLRLISQHLLFHPIVIKKWWKCDGPS